MQTNIESFHILKSVDSTNNYAMQLVHSGKARDGEAWFAIEQTNGRGRRGRHWTTEKGKNIILSIVANTSHLKIHQQFRLSAAVALACYDLFTKYGDVNIKIKWPNDLFWNDRKAGGILIENIIKGNMWQWAVIGIGININQTSFPFEKIQPVSLKQIAGNNFDPITLGKELYFYVINRLSELKDDNFMCMLNEYNLVLYKRNEKVKLKRQNIIFETTITGVSELGRLQTFDSGEHEFNFDEIEWLL